MTPIDEIFLVMLGKVVIGISTGFPLQSQRTAPSLGGTPATHQTAPF